MDIYAKVDRWFSQSDRIVLFMKKKNVARPQFPLYFSFVPGRQLGACHLR